MQLYVIKIVVSSLTNLLSCITRSPDLFIDKVFSGMISLTDKLP
jgi:hypothetical protein